MQNAVNWVRTNLINPTDLDTFYASSQTEQTDVVMFDEIYTSFCEDALGVEWTDDGFTGLLGFAACESLTPANRCEQQNVRLHWYWFREHEAPGNRWFVCHEVGHAIGLIHRQGGDGCISEPPTGTIGERIYTTHDLEHINGTW